MTDAPLPPVQIEDQVRCVERELGFRHRVYARRVADGKMTANKARDEIRAMTAVLETLNRVASGGRLI